MHFPAKRYTKKGGVEPPLPPNILEYFLKYASVYILLSPHYLLSTDMDRLTSNAVTRGYPVSWNEKNTCCCRHPSGLTSRSAIWCPAGIKFMLFNAIRGAPPLVDLWTAELRFKRNLGEQSNSLTPPRLLYLAVPLLRAHTHYSCALPLKHACPINDSTRWGVLWTKGSWKCVWY